ncbi:MAG: UDP-N-acetylmuramate--L-alanine ligase [Candidatus Faecisoma sp.]|jgi:UDP-N-acetylmuramate--alanine ligase|nr:UDP-N-acetylmuramate--L-alanine ligase [Acholeplasma sp.]MCI5678186.1 UDP-N-acetylmuramate--L-alanine ligase [Acholeplasma sp.]MDY2892436.1 UDP-N-acetylmuramate--L-alanine ligase [Candidatus Faecisoma sp.]CCY28306.1 uDP-N-acetylmuramate--L-alanine ligase [Acholeplasma sp. CAG:878]
MYYLIGIKGTGMSALAQILFDLGYEVMGSDKPDHFFTEKPLIERGIKILPFNKDNIKEDMLIVQGNAFSDTNEEVVRAKELNLKIYTYQEMVGKLTKMFNTITVAGCHGKTTTSAMLSHVLNNIVGANYLIGDGSGYAIKENNYFVLEACEYKRHFLSYTPQYAIITNIELDHIDYYKDIDDYIDAFREYANNAEKMVIACGDDQYTHMLEPKKPIFFYGLNEDNDIVARDVNYTNEGTSFDVYVEDNYYGHFDLPLFGKHMLLNSLAVIGVCYYERLDAKEVSKNLKTFKGAKRRFKEKVIGDIVTIDDYAHHPTEVKVTIKGARQKYPDKEIVAILKTHTLSRTKEMANEFAEALKLADKAYIMDVGVDREEVGYDDVTYKIIQEKVPGCEYMSLALVDKLLKHKNAVMIFMSSKDIYVLQEKYEKLLEGEQ